MYLRTTHQLSGPICKCDEQTLIWSLRLYGVEVALVIKCKNCKVEIVVPPDEFQAGFDLEIPYPGKPKPDRNVVQLKLVSNNVQTT